MTNISDLEFNAKEVFKLVVTLVSIAVFAGGLLWTLSARLTAQDRKLQELQNDLTAIKLYLKIPVTPPRSFSGLSEPDLTRTTKPELSTQLPSN